MACSRVNFTFTLPQCYVYTYIACLVHCLVNHVHPRKTWYPDQKFHWLLILDTICNTSFWLLSVEEKSYIMAVAVNILLPCGLRFLTHSLWRSSRHKDLMIHTLPYFPAVTTYHISFSRALNMFEMFTHLDVIFLWHVLYKCITDVHPLFNWIHCLHFMTQKR